MYAVLNGLRIIEGASFVAAPTCALHLLQLGAEVIRFDNIGGGLDYTRWPRIDGGPSFYWEGLNKGKKSIALDLSRPEGRELALRIATAPGENAGLVVTNFPVNGFFSYDNLRARRNDVIVVRVMGWGDGSTGLDYTVNAAIGMPYITGPASQGAAPVNHVLPAWDLMTGAYAAMSLLAAERHRCASGEGGEIRVPLADIAFASMGHLGSIAEVLEEGTDRPRIGNDVFGALGRDFQTADGARIMIVALTRRQWRGLKTVLNMDEQVAALEAAEGVSFDQDEGLRYRYREQLNAMIADALAARTLADVKDAFDEHGVCWGPYRTLSDAIAVDDHGVMSSGLFEAVTHPSGRSYPTPGASATFTAMTRAPVRAAPLLGAHTDEVLAELLALPDHEIGALHDAGLVAAPQGARS